MDRIEMAVQGRTGAAPGLERTGASPAQRGGANATLHQLLLDEVDYGMLISDGAGVLRYANQLAFRELSRPGPLYIDRDRLKSRRRIDRENLNDALSEAARGLRRLLSMQYAGHSIDVAVLPMAQRDSSWTSGEGLALLTLGRRASCAPLSIDFFARAHGLTGAETRVLHLLCTGAKPADVAQQCGVELSTVRTHIRSVRAKTQSASLRELVRRLALLPSIPSITRSVLGH
jgi:DNA-binding CsgD family transcriptional regulator